MAGGTGRRTKKRLQTAMLATNRPEGLKAHEKAIRCACLAPRSPVFWSRTHLRSSMESRISRLQSFDHLQAPALARPPDCSDRGACAPGRQAFHTTHRPAGYPDRDVASLHARHGQLAWLDSHQLGRSLVGCSFPHTAHRHRSPAGIRSRGFHRSGQAIDTEAGDPFMGEVGAPVPATESMLGAGENREAFVDVAVDV